MKLVQISSVMDSSKAVKSYNDV